MPTSFQSSPPHLWTFLARLLLPAICLPLLAMVWQAWQVAPQRVAPTQISLTLAPGASQVLGRTELAAPLSEINHLRVTHTAKGQWHLENISQLREVEVQRHGRSELLRTHRLQSGQLFAVAGRWWRVLATSPVLRLQSLETPTTTASGWWYSGTQSGLLPAKANAGSELGAAQAACVDANKGQMLRGYWNALLPPNLGRPVPLKWGGYATCENYLPLPGLEPGAVWIAREGDDFFVHAAAAASRAVCIRAQQGMANPTCAVGGFLHEQGVSLASVSRLVVGRAHYAVQIRADVLSLRPLARVEWMPQELAQARATRLQEIGVSWQLAAENPWLMPSWLVGIGHWWIAFAALLILIVLSVLLRALFAGGNAKNPVAWCSALALSFSLALLAVGLLAYGLAAALGFGCLLAGVALTLLWLCCLPWPGYLRWLALAGVCVLMVVGVVTQFHLGLQAPDTGGWRFFQKSAASTMLALALWSTLAHWLSLRAMRVVRATPLAIGRAGAGWGLAGQEMAVWGFALLALLGLFLQVLLGAEEGVFGMQPVELAKLALIISSAHLLALRLDLPAQMRFWQKISLSLQALLPITLFLGLVALSLMMLSDYSPLVVLSAWLLGMAMAWCVASVRLSGLLFAGLTMVAAGALYHWARSGDGLAWLMAHGFYPDRFFTWLNPALHPHNGQQFLRANQLASLGGWFGNANAQAWLVPAVQFDFTPAFFLGRFGVLAALLLLSLQLLWVGSLLHLGWQLLKSSVVGDYVAQWQGRLMFFSLWGFGFLFAGQFLISWGSNLGWLPVMGQPMPLLAAGSSLLALLITPFMALVVCSSAIHSPGTQNG